MENHRDEKMEHEMGAEVMWLFLRSRVQGSGFRVGKGKSCNYIMSYRLRQSIF